ncbi:chromatin binding protein [Malassezia yamatoensis]|uniref:Chromatin binding protein n=1 Tax=Malassezia yamatoensis TaxID=253288 RepID=A0AAJ6CGP6_9BASI|nr:chromatin binding protein [Malassezia yamatoensis]
MPLHFQAQHKFQDLVGRTPWSGIAFSGDGEYIMGGAAHDAGHNIYIWSRDAGALTKILEGPREPLIFAVWHPIQPQIVSIAASGDLFLWRTKWTEIWSAYAPGFEELDENVVYREREDEFDLEDEHELTRKKQNEEEGIVNVFCNGPSHNLLISHKLRSSTFQESCQWTPFESSIPNDIQNNISSLSSAQDDMQSDEYDDDDQVALIITPILAEVQPEVNGSL